MCVLRHALGVMMERLPGAVDDNIENSIKNLEEVEKKGLRSYLDRTPDERSKDTNLFRSMEEPLDMILDDCIKGMDKDSIRWSKVPRFRCGCGLEKVWQTLRLLPLDEIKSIVNEPTPVEVKCEFCGEVYTISKEEIFSRIINISK